MRLLGRAAAWLRAPLLARALFARDRITAGLADAVIVVEARPQGGAVHTAKCALEEDRTVLAVSRPSQQPAGGNQELLAHGALPLEAPEQVWELLGDLLCSGVRPEPAKPQETMQSKRDEGLSP